MADPVISSKQEFTYSLTGASGTTDLGSAVTLANTIVILSSRNGDANPANSNVKVSWVDSDTLQFDRAGFTDQVDFDVQVIEYNSEVTVHYVEDNHSGSGSDTFTAVTLANSSILGMGMEKTGTSFTTDDVYRATFTSTTAMAFRSQSSNSGQDCAAQVIDWGSTATVQEEIFTHNTVTDSQQENTLGTTLTDLTHAFIMATYDHDNGSAGHYFMAHTSKIISTTQTQTECHTQNNKDYNFCQYVVEFDADIVNVQRGEVSDFYGVGNETETEALTAVSDTDDCCVFMGGAYHGDSYGRTDRNTDERGFTSVTFDGFNADDEIQFTRNDSGNVATYLPWEVVEWVGGGGGGGTVTGDFDAAGSGSMTLSPNIVKKPGFSPSGSGSMTLAPEIALKPGFAASGSGSMTLDPFVGAEIDCSDTSNTYEILVVASDQAVAQSFTGDGSLITKARVYGYALLSPTGDLQAHIYAHSGTYGTDSVPTGSPLASSTNTIDASTVSTTVANHPLEFEFDGTYTLTNATKYCLVIDGITSGGVNSIQLAANDTSPHGGNIASFNGSTWTADISTDLRFCIFGQTQVTVTGDFDAAGSGSMTLAPNIVLKPGVSASGSGSMTLAPDIKLKPGFSPAGSGSMTLTPKIRKVVTINFSGSGSMTLNRLEPETLLPELIIVEESMADFFLVERSCEVSTAGVWNTALVALGVSRVSGTSDNSRQGLLLQDIWDDFRKQFLIEHPWAGAKTTQELVTFKNSDGTTAVNPDGTRWNYAFALPDSSDSRPYLHALYINGYPNTPNSSTSNHWEIEAVENDAGTIKRCLLTNESTVKLQYIWDVGDDCIDMLSALARQALGLALAVHIAPNFGKTPQERQLLQAQFEEIEGKAKGSNSQESTPPMFQNTPLLDAREGGMTY